MPGIPPYEFRVFSRLRGRRSWTEGLQRFASPALRTDSVLVLDVPVFGHRLMVMTALAKGLPVRFVPEQFRITAMRFDMVNDRLLLCSGCTRDDVSGKTSWPSATPIRSHVFLHQPGRPGTAVHVPHNIFFHTAPAWGSPDICRASSVFWAFTSSPASKKDRWRSSLGPSFFSC